MVRFLSLTNDDLEGGVPLSVHAFERVQITALVAGWMTASVTYHEVLRDHVDPLVFSAELSLISAVVFLLMARISRRRCSISRWLLILLSVLCIGPWLVHLQFTGPTLAQIVLSLFQGALQLGACVLLIAEPSRAWLARAKAPAGSDLGLKVGAAAR